MLLEVRANTRAYLRKTAVFFIQKCNCKMHKELMTVLLITLESAALLEGMGKISQNIESSISLFVKNSES